MMESRKIFLVELSWKNIKNVKFLSCPLEKRSIASFRQILETLSRKEKLYSRYSPETTKEIDRKPRKDRNISMLKLRILEISISFSLTEKR